MGSSAYKPQYVRSAFTLVELLVVLSIISLLIALLLPSLQAARSISNQIRCASNMKQATLAQVTYIQDNSGFFALTIPQSPGHAGLYWNQFITAGYLTGGDYLKSTIITGERACPDGFRQSYPSWPLPLYGHNACMNPPHEGSSADEAIDTLASGWGVTRLSKLDQIRKTLTVFMLNENNNYYAYTYGDTTFDLALDNHAVWPGVTIYRHNGMGLNVSYMDGHTAFVRAPFAKGINIFYDDND